MNRSRFALTFLAATLLATLLATSAARTVLAEDPATPAAAPATPAAAMSPTSSALSPQPGEAAPDFKLASTAGGKLHLKSLKGKVVVLYFYPKDETPGCTHEACDFRDHHGALDSAGVVVLGVSLDDIASHEHFRDKEHLPFPLLADEGGKVATAYGVLRTRERDGKTLTYVERTTFVIGKDGKIARVWPKVNVNGHVDDVLAFVRGG